MDEKKVFQDLYLIIDKHILLDKLGRPRYVNPDLKKELIKYCLRIIREERRQKVYIGQPCLIKVDGKVIEVRVKKLFDLEYKKIDELLVIDTEGKEYEVKYWECQPVEKPTLKKKE